MDKKEGFLFTVLFPLHSLTERKKMLETEGTKISQKRRRRGYSKSEEKETGVF